MGPNNMLFGLVLLVAAFPSPPRPFNASLEPRRYIRKHWLVFKKAKKNQKKTVPNDARFARRRIS
jgi:hypothetical protein